MEIEWTENAVGYAAKFKNLNLFAGPIPKYDHQQEGWWQVSMGNKVLKYRCGLSSADAAKRAAEQYAREVYS